MDSVPGRTAIGVFGWVLGWIALALPGAVGAAAAQPYPTRPVRLIVPSSPGGGIDFLARVAGRHLGERLGQQVVIINVAGGGGTIGTAQAAKAAPDGHTLLLGFVGPLAMIPHAEKVAYDPRRDLVGVGQLASTHLVLTIHPSLPVRSARQLIAFARARPGELNYAAGNIWNPSHLAPALFAQVTRVAMVPIFYKGTGPAAVAVLAGEAHMLFTSVPAVMPHVRARRLVALGVGGPARSPLAPEVPTFAESGVRGAETPTWYALVAPAATAPEVIGRLHADLRGISEDPGYREKLVAQALDPVTGTPDQFIKLLDAEFEKWGTVVRRLRAEMP